MLSLPKTGPESPKDRRRYAMQYSTGLTPDLLASVYSSADLGDLSGLMELLQEILKDELIGGYADIALGSLSQRELLVTPARNDPDQKRAAEVASAVKEWMSTFKNYEQQGTGLSEIGELPEITEVIDSSMYFGLALPWVYWDTPMGERLPRPVGVEQLDQRRYRLKPETNEILLESAQGSWQGTPISEYDAWNLIPVVGRSMSPRKEFAGCGRAVSILYYIKNTVGRLSMMSYGERFAVPAVIGSFNGDISEAEVAYDKPTQAKLEKFVEGFMSDAAGLFPPGFKVDIAQVPRDGHNFFLFLEQSCQRGIATAFFGQDGTSSGQGGSLAKAYINEKSRLDSIGRRGRRVTGFYRRLFGFAISLHFGANVPSPDINFGLTPDEKLAVDKDAIKTAQELGLPVSLDYALSALSLPMPADGAVLTDGTVWDGINKRRKPSILTGKDLGEAMRTGGYAMMALLNGGLGLDAAESMDRMGFPRDLTKPAYTPPVLTEAKADAANPTKDEPQ
jgi:phage gp29-like protein